MAAPQRGRVVTGLADFAGTPSFKITAHGFDRKLGVQTRDRTGRTSGRWTKSRPVGSTGSLLVIGQVRKDGFPLPSQFKGQTGTIELQFHTGGTTGATAKESLSVRVDGADTKLVTKDSEDFWQISLACTVLGDPTLTGFGGTQPDATDPTKADEELYSGLSKTYDPNNLQDGATVAYDIWPLGNTDAAELQKLADVVAAVVAAPRFPGAKVKTASLAPGRDWDGGVVTLTLSLTDTAEDVVNPITSTTVDPEKLTSRATAADINATPAGPGGDFVAVDETTQELHDNADLITVRYDLRTSKEGVEFDGSVTQADPSAIVSSATVRRVNDSETPPATPASPVSGLVLRARDSQRINRYRWHHTFSYGPRTSEQDIEFPGSPREVDPSSLTDEERVVDVTDSSTPPATPTPNNTALKLRRTLSVRLTDAGKWSHTFVFARRNTEDDVEMDGSSTGDDPSDLTDQTEVTTVTNSGTPPAASPPAGLKTRRTHTRQLHDSRWAHTFTYSRRTTEDDVEFDGSHTSDDASNLRDEQVITEVQGAAAPSAPATPSGLVLRDTGTKKLTDSKWAHSFHYARRTNAEDVTLPGTVVFNDPNDLDDRRTYTEITTDSATPSVVSFSGYRLRGIETEQIHAQGGGGTPGKWKHKHVFSRRSSVEDVEMPGTEQQVDPLSLIDYRKVTVVQTSTVASWPAEATLTRYDYTHRPLDQTYYAVTYEWRRVNTEQEKEYPHTKSSVDAGGLYVGNSAMTADVWDSTGAAPADPTNPPVDGLKLVEKYDVPITPERKLRVYLWGTANAVDKLEFNYEKVIEDANGLATALVRATVWPTTNADPGTPEVPTNEPADPGATLTVRTQTLKRKTKLDLPVTTAGKLADGTPTFAKYLRVWTYEKTDTKDDIELPRTTARYSGIEPAETRVASVIDNTSPDWSDGSASGIAAAVFNRLGTGANADKTFADVDVVKLNADKALRTVNSLADFRIVRSSSRAGTTEMKAWMMGSAVVVWCSQKIRRGTNQYWFKIDSRSVRRMVMDFEIHRRVKASTVDQLIGYSGTSNAAPFMGFPQWTVTFAGIDMQYDRLTAGPRIYDVRYKFSFDSAGQFDDTGVSTGWNYTTADLSGMNAPSIQFALRFGWPAAMLPVADYSIFIDPAKESALFTV